jgi:hypothetical protein
MFPIFLSPTFRFFSALHPATFCDDIFPALALALELHVLLSHLCADVHVKVGAGDALIHTEHIVGASLEVAGGVVGLGDKAVIGRSVGDGLHQVGHRLEAE